MRYRYRLIQYIDDLERQETVNVGLIVTDSWNQVAMRFLGDTSPERDKTEEFSQTVTDIHHLNSLWVFDEWAQWFQYELRNQSIAGLTQSLNRINETNPHFYVTEEEIVDIEEKELSGSNYIDYLFNQHIGEKFSNRVNELLQQTELMCRSGFTAKAILTIPNKLPLYFDYLFEAKNETEHKLHAIKCVKLLDVSENEATISFNDACFSLQVAIESGVLLPQNTAVLTDYPLSPLFGYLSDETHVMDVWDKTTRNQLVNFINSYHR